MDGRFARLSLPSILRIALAFNRTLLKGIATTFRTALVFGHTTIMIGALCALFHNQPAKLASAVLILPSLMYAAFIDSYPAEGRASASRLFFALNSICLVLVQVGLAFGIARIDELVVEMYGGWHFKASELAAGAINSLIPFALRNLVASIHRPDTLAVRKSDVVCVYLDEHALRVLRAVHGSSSTTRTRAASRRGGPIRVEHDAGRNRVDALVLFIPVSRCIRLCAERGGADRCR